MSLDEVFVSLRSTSPSNIICPDWNRQCCLGEESWLKCNRAFGIPFFRSLGELSSTLWSLARTYLFPALIALQQNKHTVLWTIWLFCNNSPRTSAGFKWVTYWAAVDKPFGNVCRLDVTYLREKSSISAIRESPETNAKGSSNRRTERGRKCVAVCKSCSSHLTRDFRGRGGASSPKQFKRHRTRSSLSSFPHQSRDGLLDFSGGPPCSFKYCSSSRPVSNHVCA